MTRRTSLVTGASGQDAHYLAELLHAQGDIVVGTTHRANATPHGIGDFDEIVMLDVRDDRAIRDVLDRLRPARVFNMASLSSGAGMYDDARAIGEVNGFAVTSWLEAIRTVEPAIRFLQASSSEMFGHANESPQSEATPFVPRSPYGAAKTYAHAMVRIYRERYALFACSAILFNHESPYRRAEFVSRRISRGAALVSLGRERSLRLGNLAARRDWGFAGDYAEAMVTMLAQQQAVDYVVATGRAHTVEDMCRIAFARVDLDFRQHVEVDPASVRPLEAVPLVGDPALIRADVGWRPRVSFEAMIEAMVDYDLRLLADSEPTAGSSPAHDHSRA